MSDFPLNPEQLEAARSREGVFIIPSCPGSGKTRTLVERVKSMIEDGYPADSILALTFTAKAAEEMSDRADLKSEEKVFRTFHSFCRELVFREASSLPFELLEAPPEPGKQRKLLGSLCRSNKLDFKKLTGYISSQKRKGASFDEAMEHALGAEGLRLAIAYKQYELQCRAAGWLDFDSMLIESVRLLETNKEVRDRWQFKFCHPPGTLVAVSGQYKSKSRKIKIIKQVPIENLVNGDTVLSWDRRRKRVPVEKPKTVKVGSRLYDGDLLTVVSGDKSVEVTPEHRFWVRMVNTDDKYVVYLMWKEGVGFRVGTTSLKRKLGGNGFWQRCRSEEATSGWILRVCSSNHEAHMWEEIYSLQYQIPEREFPHSYLSDADRVRSCKIFKTIDSSGGYGCLKDLGLLFLYPFYRSGVFNKKGSKPHKAGYFMTAAANIIPNLMRLPLPDEQASDLITEVKKRKYVGPVFSLAVEKDHTYVANGLVVGNCLVDEAQDTDDIQWKLVRLISETHGNIFAVGDEEQLIYEWRGAEADGLTKFQLRFPGCKSIFLFRNYRSTSEIVAFCKKFAPKKSELIDRMVSEVGSGPVPRVLRYGSDSDEASKTLSSILEPDKSAILTRTNRQLARFENACIDRGIKYNLLGKSGFWTRPEVKYLLAYMQASIFPTDAAVKTIIQSPYRETKYLKKKDLTAALKDKDDRDRAIGKPVPYISSMTDQEILKQFEPNQQDNIKRTQSFIRSFKMRETKDATQVLQDVLDKADVRTYYETEEEGDGDNDAIENINELSKIAGRYKTVPDFLDHARRAIAASRKSKQARLSLSTIHQSKGKEWDHVFVAGVNHEVLPHKRGQIMEERRIFYVACTRAAKTLTVSFFGVPSVFLKDVYTPGDEDQNNRLPPPGFKGQPTLFEGLD